MRAQGRWRALELERELALKSRPLLAVSSRRPKITGLQTWQPLNIAALQVGCPRSRQVSPGQAISAGRRSGV